MKISRRKFVAAAPLAAGVLLTAGNALSASPDTGGSAAAELFAWDSFYPYVTTSFTFRDSAGEPVEMRLTQMTDNRTPAMVGSGECFSLIFTGPADNALKHGVYTVEHFALGTFDLMVTRGITRKGTVRYEAIVNRMSPVPTSGDQK